MTGLSTPAALGLAAATTGLAVATGLGWLIVGAISTHVFPTVAHGDLALGSALLTGAAYAVNALNVGTHRGA